MSVLVPKTPVTNLPGALNNPLDPNRQKFVTIKDKRVDMQASWSRMKIMSGVQRYGFAVISCGLALALAWPLDAPSSCFLLAVMVSSLYGGKGPGFLSVALSSLAFDYFFLAPRFHLGVQPSSYLRFAVFLGAALLAEALVEAKRRVDESRKRAQEALRASAHELESIIETIPALVWCAAPDGELTYVNRRVLDYTGTNLEALAKLGWLNFLHPDDVTPTTRAWFHAVATGQPHDVQYRLRRFDGSYRWFHVLGEPARDDDGRMLRWYGLLVDVDDRRNMEDALRRMQTRLTRAAQVATVGELAASIAHEVNQPLAAVVANGHACVRWLAIQPPNLAKAHEAAERIVRDGKEAGEVIRRVRALFKRESLEKVVLDLNEVISEVLRLVSGEIVKRRVVVETELETNLPPVAGDRVQLQQLVLNLLLNGIEAMDYVLDRPKGICIRSKHQSDATVLVEIQDCGVGLEDPEKIFEAFFTTKENGLGIGLAICRSIIEAHQGRLWAASGNGAGTTFCFTLPTQTSAES
jgi:hypothetical protein